MFSSRLVFQIVGDQTLNKADKLLLLFRAEIPEFLDILPVYRFAIFFTDKHLSLGLTLAGIKARQ